MLLEAMANAPSLKYIINIKETNKIEINETNNTLLQARETC